MSEDVESFDGGEMAPTRQAADLQRQIDERTAQIVALYDRWKELRERRTGITDSWSHQPEDEHWQQVLEDLDREDAEIARSIEHVNDELDAIYDALRQAKGLPVEDDEASISPSDRLQNEHTALQRRLNNIANAQIAAIKKWNQDPTEEHRQDFEFELRSLHAEFSEVLKQRDQLSAEHPTPETDSDEGSHETA